MITKFSDSPRYSVTHRIDAIVEPIDFEEAITNFEESITNMVVKRIDSEAKIRKIVNRRLANMHRNSVGRQKWQYTR